MRSVIISLVTLISVVSLCLFHSHKTAEITREMLYALSDLQEDVSADNYEKYTKLWEKHSFFFETTLPKQKYERLIDGKALLDAAISCGGALDIAHGINISKEALISIAESDKLNLKNIL